MNFLDLLKPPDLSSMSHPFTREEGQTGAGKPAIQSLARNLFGMTHSPAQADWANETFLQDASPEQTQAQKDYQMRTSQPVQMNNTNPMLQQMLATWMKGQQ